MATNLPHGRLCFRILVEEEQVDLALDAHTAEIDGMTYQIDAQPLDGSLWSVLVDGRSLTAHVEPLGAGRLRLTLGSNGFEVRTMDQRDLLLERTGARAAGSTQVLEIRAPMPGLVLAVLVEPGQRVAPGHGLVVVEAMKMENEIRSPRTALVQTVHVAPGEAVGKNTLLIELAEPDGAD